MKDVIVLFFNGEVIITIEEQENSLNLNITHFLITFGDDRFIGSIRNLQLYGVPATTK